MTATQANNGFDIEALAPAVAAAMEELGEVLLAEVRALLAEAEAVSGEDEAE